MYISSFFTLTPKEFKMLTSSLLWLLGTRMQLSLIFIPLTLATAPAPPFARAKEDKE
jgi:hypothetical protein